jgi:hypothetical protein
MRGSNRVDLALRSYIKEVLSVSLPVSILQLSLYISLSLPSFKYITCTSPQLWRRTFRHAKMSRPKDKALPLRIGVLILPPIQLLDAAPIDLFGMLTKEYLEACLLPAPLTALGVPVEIHYISAIPFPPSPVASSLPLPPETSDTKETSSIPSTHICECTSHAGLRLTSTIHSAVVALGKLDLILIPGSDPTLEAPEEMGEFIRNHVDHGAVVMSVCTGIFSLAASGVLNGKKATGPRGILTGLRTRFGEVEWVERRWMKDERIWTSGMWTSRLTFPKRIAHSLLSWPYWWMRMEGD